MMAALALLTVPALVPLLKSAAPEVARIQLAATTVTVTIVMIVLPILATMPVLAQLPVPIPLLSLVRILTVVVLLDVPTRQILIALLVLL